MAGRGGKRLPARVRYVLTRRAPWIGPWGTRHLRPVVSGGISNSAIRIECEQCIFTVSVFSDHCVAEKSILPHAWGYQVTLTGGIWYVFLV